MSMHRIFTPALIKCATSILSLFLTPTENPTCQDASLIPDLLEVVPYHFCNRSKISSCSSIGINRCTKANPPDWYTDFAMSYPVIVAILAGTKGCENSNSLIFTDKSTVERLETVEYLGRSS